jgi:hypothetical protein
MAKKSAQLVQPLPAGHFQSELVKLIRSLSYSRHTHEVFSDFVEVAALSISNSVDKAHFEKREARYLEIIRKYKKDEVNLFPQMLGMLVLCYEEQLAASLSDESALSTGGLSDVLGTLYMTFELGNERAGQFFTPYHVSKLMAQMLIGDGAEVKQKGFLRLSEPACGAGGMVIAYADALLGAGINYQQSMHAICVDIDPRCIHMAYVQFALLHIPAVVVHGNALSLEEWGHWYTPAHILGGWRVRLARETEHEKARTEALALLNPPDAEHVPQIDPQPSDPVPVVTAPATEPVAIDFKKLEQLALF